MSGRPLEVQVAVHEERLDQLEQEQLRHRQRLHDLEGDRATIRLISRQLDQLAGAVETNAKRAALEAIDLAMKGRDEIGRRRWNLRAQWIGTGAAVGAAAAAFVELFLR